MSQDFLSDLASELRADQDTRYLADSLTQIWAALNKHWRQTHLTWFTDHGVDHARRVAKRALELGNRPNAPIHRQLSGLERYILCAASLLHDIGMNDLSLSPRPLGEMLPADYERIRHDHSIRSGDLITERPAEWGLPPADTRLADLVGLVAQAHGTKNYRTTIPLLKQRTSVREMKVRGPLLAALLLMADELDLSYSRESEVPGNIQLNAISEAHAFKHRCISSASTDTPDDVTVSISLELSMPDHLSDQARASVERWVVGKLRRQMALIEPEIIDGFGSHLRFDRVIKVTHVSPLRPQPLPSDQALAVIKADVAIDDLIDHREKFRRTGMALSNGHVVITGKWVAEKRQDFYGREDLYQATVETLSAAPNVVVACSRRLHNAGAGEPSDVLEEWAHSLNKEHDFMGADEEDEQSARDRLLVACVKAAETIEGGKVLLLGISCFDRLTEEGMRWLADKAISQISHASPAKLRLIMTAERESPVPALEPLVSVIPTEDIDRGEVVEFLSGIGLADAAVLSRSDLEYFSLKQICNRQLIDLQAEGSK